jgi:hypothetical protein
MAGLETAAVTAVTAAAGAAVEPGGTQVLEELAAAPIAEIRATRVLEVEEVVVAGPYLNVAARTLAAVVAGVLGY